ncbi:FAD/NAD(P)-binding domain-containing protein [Lophiostoma macrostomum CBS 122681]|uniref:FAD/NAD(P)-binding domain-containing protein n=1 Tax=Lophiostoma macrostomum CBS 122681 TaxID=1314788 RepID=A0A6A6SSM9_9PLEO|nr:FAD/NAD(P)-binding domain-containing protein [Lophiostoma macrostomum CBS 122681]
MSAKASAGNTGHIKVAVVGAGISGLAVANGLLKDPARRFDVQVYERDTISFSSERGGYQLRISGNGLDALRTVADNELWDLLRETWAGDEARAPTLVDPKNFNVHLRLANLKLYPSSRPVPRHGLRHALLQPLLSQGRVHLNHQITHFEYISNGQKGVELHFKDQDSQYADILIAADGSNSTINRQVGLKNKVKLEHWTLIQSRGVIDKSTRDKLPTSVLEAGSVLFLGGRESTGFVSVYDPKPELGTGGSESYTLFWSCLVPSEHGKKMIAKVGENVQDILPLLADYLRSLGYGETLAFITQAATQHLRTGLLTSSIQPKEDWRKGDVSNARVILLGDAVHPMTPGRGMGANQALTDAGKLVNLFQSSTFEKGQPSDQELATMVRVFEAEMYKRAFKMVKDSEAMTDLDLTKVSGKIFIRLVGAALTVLGWGVSLLEIVGLKKREKLDYLSHKIE